MLIKQFAFFVCVICATQTYGQENTFSNNGTKVGIHTLQPRAFFDMAANISYGELGAVFGRLPEGNMIGDGTYLGVRGFDTQNNPQSGWKSFSLEHSFYGYVNSSINFLRGGNETGGYLTFNTHSNYERMRLDQDGNLLIGTVNSSGEKLAVNGSIRAKEIKVETSNWPDYVFEPDYKLVSLDATERFIAENGHLPDVPKANIAESEGIALGEMNTVLLKKIEELTLHLIEKNKQIENLEKRVLKLESK